MGKLCPQSVVTCLLGVLVTLGYGCAPEPPGAADSSAQEEIESGTLHRCASDRGYSDLHRQWIEALPDAPVSFPRLCGGVGSPNPDANVALRGPLLALAGRIETVARRNPADPRALAAAGSVALWSGAVDRAMSLYGRAARRSPDDAGIRGDLAVAEMLSFERSGDVERSLDALESAAHAVELAPEAAEPHCNLAWVLGRHRLNGRARESWRACRHRAAPAWWPAIDRALAGLDVEPTPERWAAAWRRLPEAMVAGQPEAVVDIVIVDHQLSREAAVLELLSGWAEARRSADSKRAEELLGQARAVGAALARGGGDGTVRGAVEAIDRASGADRDRLAAGHLAFRRGFSYCRPSHDAMRAREPLEEAVAALEGAGSPVALWARTWLALGVADPDDRIAALRALLAPAEAGGTPALAGRVHWLTGLMLVRRGEWMDAVDHYNRARGWYEIAGETESLGAVVDLIAEAEGALGDERTAWALRREALDHLMGYPASRFLHNVLWQSGDSLVASGRARAALQWYEEGRVVSDRVGDPLIQCEARFRRHHAHAAFGDLDGALTDLGEASLWAKRVQDTGQREGLVARIASARGEVVRRRDPEAALADLAHAITYYTGAKVEVELGRVYLSRARAHRAMRRFHQAEDDLRVAAASLDWQRQRIADRGREREFLEVRQAVFDEWIGLLADDLEEPRRALEVVERARFAGKGSPPTLESLEASLRSLTASVEIVELALVGGSLHRWRLNANQIEYTRVVQKASRGAGERIAEYLEVLQHGNPGEEERLGRDLGALVLPGASAVSSADEALLVVVPDHVLGRLPFAALRDPATGRHLVEGRTVVVAPSIHSYLVARERILAMNDAPIRRALIVGNPAFDRARHPNLEALPEAFREAEAIAALYPERGTRRLTGSEATPGAVRAGLAEADVIHYAGHALGAPFDPTTAQLVLAPEAPGDSGLLAAQDFPDAGGGHLANLRLAVLSACSTAAAPGRRTAVVSGIAGALLDAGVPAIVGTGWPVPDEMSRVFQTTFHRHVRATGDPARALALAQREFIHHRDPTLREPRVWAAYSIVGAELPQEN